MEGKEMTKTMERNLENVVETAIDKSVATVRNQIRKEGEARNTALAKILDRWLKEQNAQFKDYMAAIEANKVF